MSHFHKIAYFADEYQGYTPYSNENLVTGKITDRKRPRLFKLETDPEPLLKTTFYYNISKVNPASDKLNSHKYERPATAMKRVQENKELKDAMMQRNRPQSAPPTIHTRPSSPYTTTYSSTFSENGSKILEDSSLLCNLTPEPSVYSDKYHNQRSFNRITLNTDRNNFLSSNKKDFGVRGTNPRNRTKSANAYSTIHEKNNNIKHKPALDVEEEVFLQEFDKHNSEDATLKTKEDFVANTPSMKVMSTTRDISKGTVLGTSYAPGFKGHIPSSLRNIQRMKDEIKDHQKLHLKDALRYQYDMHIRGYSGHIPQAVSNDRGDIFHFEASKTGTSTFMDSFGPKENKLKSKQEHNRRAYVQSQFYTQTTPSPDAKTAAQNYYQNYRPLAGRYKY